MVTARVHVVFKCSFTHPLITEVEPPFLRGKPSSLLILSIEITLTSSHIFTSLGVNTTRGLPSSRYSTIVTRRRRGLRYRGYALFLSEEMLLRR